MNNLKSYFMFSSGHRNGIFILIIIIFVLQLMLFNFDTFFEKFSKRNYEADVDVEWLKMQSKIDSLKNVSSSKQYKMYPFNPNYISDYKGYMLGMSVSEIDKLHKYRESGKFINSINDFKNVTGISDSLLNVIAPYFKFPDWVINKTNQINKNQHQFLDKKKVEKININLATKEDLIKVYGIGDKLSDIVLRDKEKFGEFVSLEQLQFVWGISPETYENLKKSFFVARTQNPLKKIKINQASTKELAQFPYFNYKIAKEIVTYRSMNGEINSIEELTKINEFPTDKKEIIVLYLEIN